MADSTEDVQFTKDEYQEAQAYSKESFKSFKSFMKQVIEKNECRYACVMCNEIGVIKKATEFKIKFYTTDGNQTLICKQCSVDSIVPIIPGSVTWGKSDEELSRWVKCSRQYGFGL